MLIHAGFNKAEIGDQDVIVHDGCIHLFHLSLPSHDRVAHLTSTDGINWTAQPPALLTGNPGDFDDDHIWTMGVCRHQGKFFMLYTGLCAAERGKVQRVGVAVSDDLFHWTKHPGNPVACADPRWYEATADATCRVDWRDPKPFVEDGVLHAVISARSNQGPANRRGCAGYFTSTNGLDWEVKPPLHVLGTCYDFETPALGKINGRYYLTGIHGQNRDHQQPDVYRVAEQLTGPYRRLPQDQLLPAGNFVFKPCVWENQTLYFHNLRGIADWPTGQGQAITSVAPPKLAQTTPDGELILRSFPGWAKLSKQRGQSEKRGQDSFSAAGQGWTAPQLVEQGSITHGQWRADHGQIRGEITPGLGALLLPGEHECFTLDCELERQNACALGLVFRADDHADCGTFVNLLPHQQRIELYTLQDYRKTPHAGVTYRWRGRRIVQDFPLPETCPPHLHLRLIAFGPYVEVSVNGRVLLSAITLLNPAGRVGVFAEDGSLTIQQLKLTPLPRPAVMDTCC